jgi:membrane-bound lytic murein transglycosylase D
LLPGQRAGKRNFEAYSQGQYAPVDRTNHPSALAALRVGMSEYDLRSVNNIPPRIAAHQPRLNAVIPRLPKKWKPTLVHISPTTHKASLAPDAHDCRQTQKVKTVASIAKRYGLNSVSRTEWQPVRPAPSKLASRSWCFIGEKSSVKASAKKYREDQWKNQQQG